MSLLAADTHTAPNLLYVLGIPSGLLLLSLVVCYGLWRVWTRGA